MNDVDKGGAKLDEMKVKYIRSEGKLHNLHNDYVIALQEANMYQQQFTSVMLPSMLEFLQKNQESFVQQWFVYCFCKKNSNFILYTSTHYSSAAETKLVL